MNEEILQYLSEEDVVLDLKPKSKRNIIAVILDHLIDAKKIGKVDKKEILKAITQREEMGSTAIGGHVSLPHARLNCVKDVILCVGISREGVDFEALDQEPVNVIVLLLSNHNKAGLHLKTLAYLAKLLRDKSFVQKLKDAGTKSEVITLIKKQQGVLG